MRASSPGGPWAWNPQQKEGYSKLRPYLTVHAAYTGLFGSFPALNFLGLRKVKKRAFSRASDQASDLEAGSFLSLLSLLFLRLLSVTLSCCLPLPSFSLWPSSTCSPHPAGSQGLRTWEGSGHDLEETLQGRGPLCLARDPHTVGFCACTLTILESSPALPPLPRQPCGSRWLPALTGYYITSCP